MNDTNKITCSFTDKIVSFSTLENTLAISHPKFENQKGRLFVTGSVPKGATDNDWAIDRPCAIAWDAVTDYMIFDSAEQYNELLKKSEEQEGEYEEGGTDQNGASLSNCNCQE